LNPGEQSLALWHKSVAITARNKKNRIVTTQENEPYC